MVAGASSCAWLGSINRKEKPGAKEFELRARRFDALARPLGPSFLVSSSPYDFFLVDAAETAGRDLAFTWGSVIDPAHGTSLIQARVLRADGIPRSDVLQVAEGT
jgi:hypothetical protein